MKIIFSILIASACLAFAPGCVKDSDGPVGSCSSLPHSAPPAGLAGGWANGYASYTQLIDVYNGRVVGNAWTSGRYFKFTPDGRNAEFYYSAQSQYMQAATKASGSIAFDEGSTAQSGSFLFSACNAHYKGWGSTSVDRNATESELTNNLTSRYYYKIEGQWLRIEPKGPVNEYSASFRLVN